MSKFNLPRDKVSAEVFSFCKTQKCIINELDEGMLKSALHS
jgi:hypothetical protein